MDLSHEDTLRLNVLMANNIDAIRIDENRLIVYGLSGDKESKAPLSPNCRNDQYLKKVRAFLSGHVLGSPGGYPIFMRRWTRMGQARDSHLADLLKLGEPEAVIAVAGAAGLTNDLARRAWWIDPISDNARRMLQSGDVVKGSMGAVLVHHLVEHLPFETEAHAIIDTVKLILLSGLASEQQKQQIWNRGRHRRAYHIGFLAAAPDALLEVKPARHDFEQQQAVLQALPDNAIATLLLRLLGGPGQTFLAAAESVLRRPTDQDEVIALLGASSHYCRSAHLTEDKEQDIQKILQQCATMVAEARGEPLAAVCQAVPGLHAEIQALIAIAGCDEAIVTPIFTRTDAVGSVMRKKLQPVTDPVLKQFAILRGLKP